MSETPDEDTTDAPEMLDAAEAEHDTVKKSEDGDSGDQMLPTARADHDSSEFSNQASDAVTFDLVDPGDQ